MAGRCIRSKFGGYDFLQHMCINEKKECLICLIYARLEGLDVNFSRRRVSNVKLGTLLSFPPPNFVSAEN